MSESMKLNLLQISSSTVFFFFRRCQSQGGLSLRRKEEGAKFSFDFFYFFLADQSRTFATFSAKIFKALEPTWQNEWAAGEWEKKLHLRMKLFQTWTNSGYEGRPESSAIWSMGFFPARISGQNINTPSSAAFLWPENFAFRAQVSAVFFIVIPMWSTSDVGQLVCCYFHRKVRHFCSWNRLLHVHNKSNHCEQ